MKKFLLLFLIPFLTLAQTPAEVGSLNAGECSLPIVLR